MSEFDCQSSTRGSYWINCRATQAGSSGMAEPVGSTWMVPSSTEQKLRLPLPAMGIATARKLSAGAETLLTAVKLYPFLVPAASRVSIRQAPVELGGVQLVPPREASVGA